MGDKVGKVRGDGNSAAVLRAPINPIWGQDDINCSLDIYTLGSPAFDLVVSFYAYDTYSVYFKNFLFKMF